MPGSGVILRSQSTQPSLEPESRTLVVMEWDSEAKNLGRKQIEKQRSVAIQCELQN